MNTRLLKLRQEAELQQNDYVSYLGIIQRTISNVERDCCKNYNFELLVKYAILYDTTIEYIMGLTDIDEEFPKDKINEIILKYHIDITCLKKIQNKIRLNKNSM
ncbi:MAG: hypothetical protein RR406_05390 [Bacilli bacterium]